MAIIGPRPLLVRYLAELVWELLEIKILFHGIMTQMFLYMQMI